MRIAIPAFGTRVSPRFDCAPEFVLVELVDGREVERQCLSAVDWAPWTRVRRLLELGADTVLCGAIDCYSDEWLRNEGATVYGWQSGSIDDVLGRFVEGDIPAESTSRRGANRRRHRRRRRGCWPLPGTDQQEREPTGETDNGDGKPPSGPTSGSVAEGLPKSANRGSRELN